MNETIQIIAAVISIAMIIVFFGMSSKLSNIRDEQRELRRDLRRTHRAEQNALYQTNRVLENKHEAIQNLTFVMMYDLNDVEMTKLERRAKYDQLKAKHADKFAALGVDFFEYPFKD